MGLSRTRGTSGSWEEEKGASCPGEGRVRARLWGCCLKGSGACVVVCVV